MFFVFWSIGLGLQSHNLRVHFAKAKAVLEGLDFAGRLGLRNFIVEGNAQLIFHSFDQNVQDLSYIGLILTYAYGLASRFNFFKAHYVPRYCNAVADKVARLAKDWDDHEWINEVPRCIQDVLTLNYVH